MEEDNSFLKVMGHFKLAVKLPSLPAAASNTGKTVKAWDSMTCSLQQLANVNGTL